MKFDSVLPGLTSRVLGNQNGHGTATLKLGPHRAAPTER